MTAKPTTIDQARAITTVLSFSLGMLAVCVIAMHRFNARLAREEVRPEPPEPVGANAN